jgi:hypothetical protein
VDSLVFELTSVTMAVPRAVVGARAAGERDRCVVRPLGQQALRRQRPLRELGVERAEQALAPDDGADREGKAIVVA